MCRHVYIILRFFFQTKASDELLWLIAFERSFSAKNMLEILKIIWIRGNKCPLISGQYCSTQAHDKCIRGNLSWNWRNLSSSYEWDIIVAICSWGHSRMLVKVYITSALIIKRIIRPHSQFIALYLCLLFFIISLKCYVERTNRFVSRLIGRRKMYFLYINSI